MYLIKITFSFLLVFCCVSRAAAQNFVKNGNFEQYDAIPFTMGQADLATYWDNVVVSSDFSYSLFSGTAHWGFGCMGILSYHNEDGDSETIGQDISDNPLQADSTYQFRFYGRGSQSICTGLDLTGLSSTPPLHGWGHHPTDFPGATLLASSSTVLVGNYREYTAVFTAPYTINYIAVSLSYADCYQYVNLDDVWIRPYHPIDLGSDIEACAGDTVTLHYEREGAAYRWSDDSTESSLTVTETGVYTLHLTADSVTYVDSVFVNFLPYPEPDLGEDVQLCDEAFYAIEAGAAEYYRWNDGTQNSFLLVTETGNYAVAASNGSCTVRDTLRVEFSRIPTDILGADGSICPQTTRLLDAFYPQAEYLWQDSSRQSSYLVTDPGSYAVTITAGDCVREDSLFLEEELFDCVPCHFYLPNAFSPNFDGINDELKAEVGCVFAEYTLSVYDRWGARIFYSLNPQEGWDGRYKGAEMPSGVYTAVAEYRFTTKRESRLFKGNVTLIR